MQILKQRDLVDVPWKNGGGITRNIARGMRADQAVWTISHADVAQDGPFSDFAGMMRVLTVVSGGPMILETPTAAIDAALWQPVRFDGGLKVNSRLTGGPLTDLNLMFDPTHCDGMFWCAKALLMMRSPVPSMACSPFTFCQVNL